MNQYAPYVNTYKNQRVETASPETLIIMLYDGAIRFLNVAKSAQADGDIETFHNHVVKAQRIVFELMASLDMEIGGEVAGNLYRLYDYLHSQLIQADLKTNVLLLDEVQTHLRELRDSWQQAIEISKKGESASGQASDQNDSAQGSRSGNVYSA
ncbi:MAG: flagellar export chaperone FliS [Cyanobacteria bacterium HKST-UBA04]|nr:flagellar export chaperone FliS [Cyanobacteria bacterium HKST-UBA04]